MRSAASAKRVALILVLVCLGIYAYFLTPFTFGDKRVIVPKDRELDGIHHTLLIADGIEKLLTNPRTYYDTAFLYPDRNQLRGTEPFTGFVLLGLPLKALGRLSDVDVMEVSRWAMVFISLTFAFLLFRTLGVGAGVSVAGAVLCLSQPDLINDIERVQIVSIPLIFPVLYYGTRVWMSGRLRDSAGLFVSAALYPLFGVINATIAALAVVFVLPLFLKILAVQHGRKRLAAFVLPLGLALVFDAVVLGPWLLDRSDLAVYTDEAFLRVKHWNAMRVPLRLDAIPAFVTGRIGLGLAAAVAILAVSAVLQRAPARRTAIGQDELAPSQRYLAIAGLGLVGLGGCYRFGSLVPWLQILFQAMCYVTLLLYWGHQVRFAVTSDQAGVRASVLMLTSGLALFLCLMAFGPTYSSNDNLFASHILRVLLLALPPLRSIREFYRLWVFGLLFLSIYVTVGLGGVVRRQSAAARFSVAVVVMVAAIYSLYTRQLVASVEIEAPREIVQLASHSNANGAVYVHPRMQWNTLLSVWMVAIARDLQRPVVNGVLGLEPPYFGYAASVLDRFPDAEAVWLLRRWKVVTTVSLTGDVGPAAGITKVFQDATGVVYEVASPAGVVQHPSEDTCLTSGASVRVAAAWPDVTRVPGGSGTTVTLPEGFRVKKLEFSFRPSVVDRIPRSIEVYAAGPAGRTRLNEGSSGDWIESLAASALVRRRSPVATVRLTEPGTRQLQLEFRNSDNPPVERLALCGEWTGDH